MPSELLFFLAAGVLILLITLWRFRPLPRWKELPYTSRKTLLSQGELAFYRTLRKAVPGGTTIFCKVRLADLISCPRGVWHEFGRSISGKHVDFVLVGAGTTEILLAIELDDKSHEERSRKEQDGFVDAALQAAGIPVLRIKAAARYDAREIGRLLAAALRN